MACVEFHVDFNFTENWPHRENLKRISRPRKMFLVDVNSAISCYYNWKCRIIGHSDSQFSIAIKGFRRLNGSSQNYYVEIQLVSYFEFACETRGLNNELNLRPCSNITAVWPQFRIVLSMWCVRSNYFMQKLILAVVFSYLRCLYISNESNVTNGVRVGKIV